MINKESIVVESLMHILLPIRYLVIRGIKALFWKKQTNILLACFPKSGSTFISEVVGLVDGFRKVPLHRVYGRVDQDIDPLWAMRFLTTNTITQQHVKYNENTQLSIQLFELKPVVLVRNIFDVVISVRDHIRNESYISPTAWMDSEHPVMDDEKLESFITDMVVPWYISFYASWMSCNEAIFIKYEDLLADPRKLFMGLFEEMGMNVTSVALDRYLESMSMKNTRKNVGVGGRGKGLSEKNKNKIVMLCKNNYPHIDFSRIGI